MGNQPNHQLLLKEKLLLQNKLLESIRITQLDFLNKGISYGWCDNTLKNLITLSNSEIGFICELLHKEDGTPFIVSHGISNIAWNETTRIFYESHRESGLEFSNFNSLWGAAMTSGEPVIANDPDHDPRRGGYPKKDGHPPLYSFLALPIKGGSGEVVGVMGVANRPGGYTEEVATFLEPFVNTYGILIEKSRLEAQRKEIEAQLIAAKEAAEKLSITDALTTLYNRRFFDIIFEKEVARAQRDGKKLTFGILDVDYFKCYNDSYGHQAGDEILCRISTTLMDMLKRSSDFIFRLGGEEFAVLIPGLEPEQTRFMAEKLCQAIEKLKIPHKENSSSPWVTISAGMLNIDMATNKHNTESIYRAADKALYRAKEKGRNQVVTEVF